MELKLKELRKSKGVSQTFLAQKLGFKSVSSYSLIEKGKYRLDVLQAKKIADALGVEITDLFADTN